MQTPIISFYSDIEGSTYYSGHAKRLRENCDRLGMKHDIRELPSSKDWRLNTLKKPLFILNMLFEKGEPLIWSDVDCVYEKSVDFLDDLRAGHDLGICYQLKVSDLGIQPKLGPEYLLPVARTMFFNFSEGSLRFLHFWGAACKESETSENEVLGDHSVLIDKVLFSKRLADIYPLSIAPIPPQWYNACCPNDFSPFGALTNGKEKLAEGSNSPWGPDIVEVLARLTQLDPKFLGKFYPSLVQQREIA